VRACPMGAHDYNDHRDYFVTVRLMAVDTWTVAEAKAKFSEVIDHAQAQGPQTITRNGRQAVVIVAAEEWERRNRRSGSLAEFFAASPLPGSKLKVRRSGGAFRKLDL
jgi:prevent-host-death family protein